MQQTVRSLLKEKGPPVVRSVGPQNTVFEAIERMDEWGVGALVVLDGERLVGIISERDYTRKIALKQRSSMETRVDQIMIRRVVTVNPTCSVDECMALMTQRRIRHLPVLDEGRVVGVVSIGDVVRAVIEIKGILIDHLERYIVSSG